MTNQDRCGVDTNVLLRAARLKEQDRLILACLDHLRAKGDPLRILYAFDNRRVAILLIAGDKVGDDRWYEVYVPIADRLFQQHLKTAKREEG